MEVLDEIGEASRPDWHSSDSLWMNKTFIGLFCDPYTSDTNLEGGPPVPAARELGGLSRRLARERRVEGLTDLERDALDKAGRILEEGADRTEKLNGGMGGGAPSCKKLKEELLGLEPGGMALLLGGWSKKSCPGHAVTYTLERVTEDDYAFTITNTGGGVNYHPSHAGPDCYPRGKPLCAWRLMGIKKYRLCTEAFLYSLMLPCCEADDKNGAGQLYEVHLPYLVPQHDGGLNQATCPEWGKPEFCTSAQKAGYCYFKCVAASLRYLWARFGITRERRKRLMLHIRRMAVGALEGNLAQLSGLRRKRPLPRAGQLVVELACRQLMLKAKRERRMGLTAEELAGMQRLVARVDRYAAKLTWDQRIPVSAPIWSIGSRAEVHGTGWPGLGLALRARQKEPGGLGKAIALEPPATLNLQLAKGEPADVLRSLLTLQRSILEVTEDRWATLQAAAVVEWGVSRLLPTIQPDGAPWSQHRLEKGALTGHLRWISEIANTYASCILRVASSASPGHHAVQTLTLAYFLAAYDALVRCGGDATSLGASLKDEVVYSRVLVVVDSLPLVSPEWCAVRNSLRVYRYFVRGADMLCSMPDMDEKKQWVFKKDAREGQAKATISLVERLAKAAGLTGKASANLHAALEALKKSDPKVDTLTIEDLGSHAKILAWMVDDSEDLHRRAPEWHDYFGLMMLLQWIARSPLCRLPEGKTKTPGWCHLRWKLEIKMIGPKMHKKPEVIISGEFQSRVEAFALDLAKAFPKSIADVNEHEPQATLHDEASVILLPQFSLAPFASHGELCLTEEEAEAVLSALSTPYLRIPLLLQFFAEDRLPTLRHARLRAAFESALSEPGTWGSLHHPPSQIPADPNTLGTPEGLLMLEVRHNLASLWTPLASIINDASELSRLVAHDSGGTEVFMTVVRVVSRVHRAMIFAGSVPGAWQTTLTSFGRTAVSRLQRWFEDELSIKERPPDVARCAKFQAHIAFSIVPRKAEFEDAAAALVALTYSSAWTPQKARKEKKEGGEEEAKEEDKDEDGATEGEGDKVREELLGVGLCELWEVMQAWRPFVLQLLAAAPAEQRQSALNAAVRAVSHGADIKVDFADGAAPGYYTGTAAGSGQRISVDVQRFQVVFHDQALRPMPASITKTPEYRALFGSRYPNCRLQTYAKGSIAVMTLGKETYELRLYKADPHRATDGKTLHQMGFPAGKEARTVHFDGIKYIESGAGEMLGALKMLGAVGAALDCLKDLVVDKIRDDLFKKEVGAFSDGEIRLNWYVPERLPAECPEATLLCSSTCKIVENDGWYEFRLPRTGPHDGGRSNPGKRLLRLFALVDHGRMPLRTEIWASDYRISTRRRLVPSVLPREKSLPFALRACAGRISKPWPSFLESLEIKRERDGAFHIPNEYLEGLLPGVLLEDQASFTFWLLDEGSMIIGEPSKASDWFNYRLLVQPGDSRYEAVVRREPLKGGDPLLMLNAAGAPDGSPLLRLARLFAPFERLSHTLFWAQEQTDGSLPNLASIELPRLQLRFAPRESDEFGAVGKRPASPARGGGRGSPELTSKWQVMLGGTWKDFEPDISATLEHAHASGAASCNFESHGHSFVADFATMMQRSPHSDKQRPIRREAPPPSARAAPEVRPDVAGADMSRITRLESVEFDGFYVVELGELAGLDERAEQLQSLLEAVPHSLILRHRSGQVKVLVANALPIRPRIKELPFTVNLAFDFSVLSQLSRKYFAWDLHVSGSLLLSTTLLGTLYLCLLRFLHRDFIRVAKLLGSCTFDTELSPDEGRVFARFFCGPREEDLNGVDPGDMAKMSVGVVGGGVLDDLHPDAVALRLRLAIIGADYRYSPQLRPFRKYLDKSLSGEYGGYVSKLGHVSQLCRLTFTEERRLLGILEKAAGGGGRRAQLIAALRKNPPGPGHDPGLIVKTKVDWSTGAPCKNYAEFLHSCQDIGDWEANRFWTYVHIDKDQQFGDKDAGSGIHLYKGKWQTSEMCHDGHCAFVSIYAALRGDAELKVCGTNASGQISELLTRYLWFNAKSEDGGIPGHTQLALMFLHLLLRARRAKRHKAWPDFRDIAKGRDGWIHLTDMHGGPMSSAFTRKLWDAAAQELKEDHGYMLHAPLRRWPEAEQHSAEVTFDPSLHWPPSPPQLLVGDDPPVLTVEEEDLRALLAAPTSTLKMSYVKELEPVAKDAALAFEEDDLRKLPGGRSETARAMISQLLDGVQEYGHMCSARVPLTLNCLEAGDLVAAATSLQNLLKELVDAWRVDVALLVAERGAILSESSYIAVPARGEPADPLSDCLDLWTGQRAGDVEPWLEWCLGALMFVDDGGGASGRLQQLQAVNRHLGEDAAKKITQRVLRLLLLAGRIGVLQNATQVAYGLLSACRKAGAASLDDLPPASRQQIEHAAGQLAAFLSVHREGDGRTYVRPDGSFDYRFLLFEYVSGFFLRQKQSEIVAELFSANTRDKPYIVQMIMGGGKTACVAPLLTLLLAHPKRLVVNVVPDSLVAQTRDIMRGLFGIALSRQVVTLAFSREVGRDGRGVGKGKKPDDEEEDEEDDSKPLVESGAQTLRRLYAKLNSAMENCAVVITTPVAMKSLMLKYVEVELQGQKEIKEQSAHLSKILKMLRSHGVALIDEVDWVLHPLKSELNFPLGTPVLFDDQEIRVSVAMHLVDAMFLEKSGGLSASAAVCPRFKEVESGAEAQSIKDALVVAVQEGATAKALQRLPHLLLHSPDYYHAKMRLPLCRWVVAWAAVENPVAKSLAKAAGLTKEHLVEYLNADKIHGTEICAIVEAALSKSACRLLNLARTWLHSLLPFLLTRGDRVAYGLLNEQERNAAAKASSPRSRLLMAVPFVAKDAPSGAAEFAHPDVLIGYTVLAYRHEGLRPQDVEEILHDRVRRARLEPGPYAVRQTCREFRAWVQQAQIRSKDPELKTCMVPELPIIRFVAGPSLYSQLWELLQRQDEVIYWYLSNVVFPTVLRKQNRKLSASGQELGSEMIFRNRLGFSGTPSSLLPKELGTCHFDLENVGEIISTLSSPSVVDSSVVILEDEWSPKGFLKGLAEADPPFSALIDTGAIVTGMSNEQVARVLLAHLPRDFCDGVVFLDPRDRQLIVQHSVSHPVPVKESGVPPGRRFCFYDQVHTTGIDVKHRADAKAAITLSASLTYRDFAQGAWRMRGIGIGQTLVAFSTVEVRCRICEVLGQPPDARAPLPFVDALRFLLANHFSSEQKQFNVLQGQNLGTIWRKCALEDLLEGTDMKKALKEFEDSLAFPLPDAAPAPAMLHDALQDTFQRHVPYMRGCDRASERMIHECKQLIDTVKAASLAASEELGAEVCKEKEQEKEQCVLKETVPTIATEDHAESAWPLAALGDPRSMAGFYPLRKFRMTGIKSFTCRYDVYVTANHTRNGMNHDSSSESRQLKPVQVIMQWISGGRTFTAAISLAEAATLRKVLHCSAEDAPPFELWLRHGQLGNISSCLGGKMLPLDGKARQYGFAQQQVLRLFNVDVDFTHEEVLAALETMQNEGSTPAERELIVQILLGSRRREAMAWETTMLRKLVYEDSAVLNQGQLLTAQLKRQVKGEASRLWTRLDVNGDLVLTNDELRDGLAKLGLSFSAREVAALLRHMDVANKGCVHLHEFEAALRVPQRIDGLSDHARKLAAAEAGGEPGGASRPGTAGSAASGVPLDREPTGVLSDAPASRPETPAEDSPEVAGDKVEEPPRRRASTVAAGTTWKVHRRFAEFDSALDVALAASAQRVEERIKDLETAGEDFNALSKAVLASYWKESKEEIGKVWDLPKEKSIDVPVLKELGELKKSRCPVGVRQTAMRLAARALTTGELEEDMDAGAFGEHTKAVLKVPENARKLHQQWADYKAHWAALREGGLATLAQAMQVLVFAMQFPICSGLAVKAMLRIEATVALGVVSEPGVNWLEGLAALCTLLQANATQPAIQECGLRVTIRVAATDPLLRSKLVELGWTRVASTASNQHAGTSVATVAGWLLSLVGGEDPLVAAVASDTWSPLEVTQDGEMHRATVALPPGSKLKLFACGANSGNTWSCKLPDRGGESVYELAITYSAAEGIPSSVRSGIEEGRETVGFFPFGDAQEPFEIVFCFTADKVELFVNGKRTEHIDAANPARTCKSVEIAGLLLPHLWAQLQEEGGSTLWQIFSAGGWVDMPPEIDALLKQSKEAGEKEVQYSLGRGTYVADLERLVQINQRYGTERQIREPARRELAGAAHAGPKAAVFQIKLGDDWQDVSPERQEQYNQAKADGVTVVFFESRGQQYEVDLEAMVQKNVRSGKGRALRERPA